MVLDSIRDKLENLSSDEAEKDQKHEASFQIKSASEDLTVIPDKENVREIDIRYSLLAPFADAHITWDDDEEELVYNIDEPTLNDHEQELFERIKGALEQKIDVSLESLDTRDKVLGYLEEKIDEVTKELGIRLSEEEKTKLMYFIYRNFAGLNEIEPLMHDPYIEDIGCSGIGIPTFIVHSKFGSMKTNLTFDEEGPLKNLVVKLAERCGKYVSYSNPLLDGSLPDGSRVNASLTQDVTTKGPTFSIRKFQETPYSAVDLIDLGTANFEIMAYFWLAQEYQKSILISGGTATGKTTFLNSIVTFIPPEHKIVSIEDTRELQLPHENWIPSVARGGFGQDEEDDINMYRLLKESFRQNPDYVVVGEVRGEEASVLFQGMSSGHPSMGTIHASSPEDVVKRLTTPPINLSPSLVETLDIIVIMSHARQYGENARRVKAVYEVETITPEGSPRTNQYVSWTAIDDTFSFKNESAILDEIKQQYGFSQEEIEEELENRKKVLEWMHENGYKHFTEVARIVSEYYKDSESVMQAIEEEQNAFIEEEVSTPGEKDKMSASLEQSQQELVEGMKDSEAAEAIKAGIEQAKVEENEDQSVLDDEPAKEQEKQTSEATPEPIERTDDEKQEQEPEKEPEPAPSDTEQSQEDEQAADENPFDENDIDVDDNPFES
ncbi:MAG: type II/IV secretion system ATPase subunit [Candidatus Nanohaloarchaeota archaeon QJJ-5]|nr:type II/IV secretion system ATPase subunit [Candidatus Nanohaloarchaeota archaeon QJJ-5]